MGYLLDQKENGKYSVFLTDEPQYCYPLEEGQDEMPESLSSGMCLVLFFAVWSMPDRLSIKVALESVKKFKGKVKLGLCPFNDQEVIVWNAPKELPKVSPLWVFYRDGMFTESFVGVQSKKEIIAKLKTMLNVE
ncbi:hypothetical protein HYR99_41820 [Candidatus Poribacteria bacterium]|nr:hypothetical protein [Candidatus Poribacteria bacterium]